MLDGTFPGRLKLITGQHSLAKLLHKCNMSCLFGPFLRRVFDSDPYRPMQKSGLHEYRMGIDIFYQAAALDFSKKGDRIWSAG